MENTQSRTSQATRAGDEGDRNDEGPSTSLGDTFHPEQISHNMNDFKALDFNSADEVRQAMKAVLAGKMPPKGFTEEGLLYQQALKGQKNSVPVKINEFPNKSYAQDAHKTGQRTQAHQKTRHNKQGWNYKKSGPSRINKGGRPPKAGPSRAIKKPKISSMYLGKLSNVVRFKRRHWDSESESDVESVVLFY